MTCQLHRSFVCCSYARDQPVRCCQSNTDRHTPLQSSETKRSISEVPERHFSSFWKGMFDLVTLYVWSKRAVLPLQHVITFSALCLLSVRVDGVSSTSAFHYLFSPSPPPIISVTSNTILVVLWGRTPRTSRKLLDHCGTSSWQLYCVIIPSMQSCAAAWHIICNLTCGLWFSLREGRIVSSFLALRDDQVPVDDLHSCFREGEEFLLCNMYLSK